MVIVDATAIDRQAYASDNGAIPAAAIVGGRHKVHAGTSVDVVVALNAGPYLLAVMRADRLAVALATPLRVSS